MKVIDRQVRYYWKVRNRNIREYPPIVPNFLSYPPIVPNFLSFVIPFGKDGSEHLFTPQLRKTTWTPPISASLRKGYRALRIKAEIPKQQWASIPPRQRLVSQRAIVQKSPRKSKSKANKNPQRTKVPLWSKIGHY